MNIHIQMLQVLERLEKIEARIAALELASAPRKVGRPRNEEVTTNANG